MNIYNNDVYKKKLRYTFSMNVEAILKKYSQIKYVTKHLYLSDIPLALKEEDLFIPVRSLSSLK